MEDKPLETILVLRRDVARILNRHLQTMMDSHNLMVNALIAKGISEEIPVGQWNAYVDEMNHPAEWERGDAS
jgi:hypothetical protein